LISILRINALEKPLSIIEFETAINIAIIAIIPYSAGDNNRAKTNPTKKVIPEFAILSTKLQATPLTALFLRELDTKSKF